MAEETKDVAFISKMSVKALGCKPNVGLEDGKPNRLCVIFGKADGFKVGEDANGKIWQALTGDFIGKNIKTGEQFRSGKLFLPSGIQEVVENAVKGKGENATVKFGLELRSVVAGNPIGYSYQAVNLIKAEAIDEVQAMLENAGDSTDAPKLEAPKSDNKKK